MYKLSKRDILLIGGDQNAKSGLVHKDFPEVLRRYRNGVINSNGRVLAEIPFGLGANKPGSGRGMPF